MLPDERCRGGALIAVTTLDTVITIITVFTVITLDTVVTVIFLYDVTTVITVATWLLKEDDVAFMGFGILVELLSSSHSFASSDCKNDDDYDTKENKEGADDDPCYYILLLCEVGLKRRSLGGD